MKTNHFISLIRARCLHILHPCNLTTDEQHNASEQALTNWKRDRAWQDIQNFIKVYARKLGV
ncbi:hypothetical protein IQ277_20225 [Nostocales cyanobacterium LEGE 12452]|nr:hypothetical protein [Nostocales cyanobacterium LEGE 12452]